MICEKCIHNSVCKYGEARSNGLYCNGEACKQFHSNSNVATEVVEQFKEIVKHYLLEHGMYFTICKNALKYAEAELRKKYESESTNNDKL